MFTRDQGKEILKAINPEYKWFTRMDRETWFEKVGFNSWKPRKFHDGSDLWSVVPQRIKDKYMYKDLGCANTAPQMKVDIMSTPFHGVSLTDMICVKQETKDTSMYKDERTEAQQAKDYLIKSLDAAAYTKQSEIREEFNLNSNPIQNLGELRKAVEGSWLKVDPAFKDYGDNYPVHFMFDFITVENPDRKVDREGAEKARKAMIAAQSDVKDQIVVMGPEKGLEALNEFKSKTFH